MKDFFNSYYELVSFNLLCWMYLKVHRFSLINWDYQYRCCDYKFIYQLECVLTCHAIIHSIFFIVEKKVKRFCNSCKHPIISYVLLCQKYLVRFWQWLMAVSLEAKFFLIFLINFLCKIYDQENFPRWWKLCNSLR